ncbi:MAG: oxidoreductase [Chitinophagales bacterium]|nr:MAG: oxidoreductase [Chitinophagales bacterium]
MKAFQLVKHGRPEESFRLTQLPDPSPAADEVTIEVEAFGLNFADIMARLGLYRECPPLPAVIGYDVVGYVKEIGSHVTHLKKGQRVVALTRFGGYASLVKTKSQGAVPLSETTPAGEACALATQCCTAYYAAEVMVRLNPGNHVLIQAAAGGVGSALVQIARHRGCIIYGAAGSEEKLHYLKRLGVNYPINYRKNDFYEEVKKIMDGQQPDVIFNSIGGRTVSEGLRLLGAGGRMVCYGAAEAAGSKIPLLAQLKLLWGFGLILPPALVMQSKSFIGINMLRIADHKPSTLQHCLHAVVQWYNDGVLKPHVGGVFKAEQLAEAHRLLETRQSIGKLVVQW